MEDFSFVRFHEHYGIVHFSFRQHQVNVNKKNEMLSSLYISGGAPAGPWKTSSPEVVGLLVATGFSVSWDVAALITLVGLPSSLLSLNMCNPGSGSSQPLSRSAHWWQSVGTSSCSRSIAWIAALVQPEKLVF